MFILNLFTGILIIFLLAKFLWSRRYLYYYSRQFKGPFAWPFIGNALFLTGNDKDILQKLYNLSEYSTNYNNEPIRFWFGLDLVIMFKNPNHVEKILSSTKLTAKHSMYDLIKIYLGEGLIPASGPTYKLHRKLIQPMFDLKFCRNQIDKIDKYVKLCMEEQLKSYSQANDTYFDIEKIIHHCFFDIILDIVMGVDKKELQQNDEGFFNALNNMYSHGYHRLIRPWLHFDFIYILTGGKAVQDDYVQKLRSFTEEVVIESWKRRKLCAKSMDNPPIIDQIAAAIESNPALMTAQHFVDDLITLFAASEDTLTTNTAFTLVCLGFFPNYQKKIFEELTEVFGDKIDNNITLEKLNKLKYMDMCIKEAIRLIPAGPFILRSVQDDIKIDKWIVPKGAAVFIPIYNLHFDPNQWEHPFDYFPEHFLPESLAKRHNYAYLPFSAGPRNCIGKFLANVGIKIFLCHFFNRFNVLTEGSLQDVKFKTDISVRKQNGYVVKIVERNQ